MGVNAGGRFVLVTPAGSWNYIGIPASSAIPSVAEKELDVIFFIRYLTLRLITASAIVILYFGFYQEHISYLKKISITSSFISVNIQS